MATVSHALGTGETSAFSPTQCDGSEMCWPFLPVKQGSHNWISPWYCSVTQDSEFKCRESSWITIQAVFHVAASWTLQSQLRFQTFLLFLCHDGKAGCQTLRHGQPPWHNPAALPWDDILIELGTGGKLTLALWPKHQTRLPMISRTNPRRLHRCCRRNAWLFSWLVLSDIVVFVGCLLGKHMENQSSIFNGSGLSINDSLPPLMIFCGEPSSSRYPNIAMDRTC